MVVGRLGDLWLVTLAEVKRLVLPEIRIEDQVLAILVTEFTEDFPGDLSLKGNVARR
jgi:hypothetical protein